MVSSELEGRRSARNSLLTAVALLTALFSVAGALEAARAAQPSAVEDAAETPVRRDLPPPAGPPLQGQELEEQVYRLASELRCPVCQGLSVAASPSPSAVAMREEIHDLLAEGYSKDQVVAYFEGAYGEFVRLVPKAEGFNLLVWVVPVIALLFGLFLVWRFAGRGAENGADQSGDDEELAEFLAEVRSATESATSESATSGGPGAARSSGDEPSTRSPQQ